jgi:hypothetical protein
MPTLDRGQSYSFIRDKQRMLHKDYDRGISVEKKVSGREPEEAWRQDELTVGKSPVVK